MNMFICQASTNSQILGILSSLPSRGGGGRTNPKIVAMQEWFSKNVFGTCPNLVVPEVVKESVIGCEGGKRTKELFVRLLNSILTVMVVEAVEKGSNVLLLGLNFGGKKSFLVFFFVFLLFFPCKAITERVLIMCPCATSGFLSDFVRSLLADQRRVLGILKLQLGAVSVLQLVIAETFNSTLLISRKGSWKRMRCEESCCRLVDFCFEKGHQRTTHGVSWLAGRMGLLV